MLIAVNGTELFFDVEGAGLVPDGRAMVARPTLLLLHGGPGGDHSLFKPLFGRHADVAQVVYLDQRGHGRCGLGGPSVAPAVEIALQTRARSCGCRSPCISSAAKIRR